ncbi:MAG: ARPP-1 family domain-containing protein, partial [Planctomycetota bacterium]
GAQTARPVGAGREVLTEHLDRANIHPPIRLGRLTVFPIVLASHRPLRNVLTMDQALRRKLLVIEELDRPQVGRARFINKSGRHMIFLMAGEVVTGGRQNRTLIADALLAPDSATVLPMYCVQKGRWEGRAGFAARNYVAPQAVRERAAQKAGQDELWAEVARANRRLGAVNTTGDLAEAMASPANRRKLDALRRRIVPDLPGDCAGVVVAHGGRIVGADLFNDPDLFAAMRAKVLNSYLSQYGMGAAPRHRMVPRPPSQNDVRDYLQACYRARVIPSDMRGVGRIYDVRGARHGQMPGSTPSDDRPAPPAIHGPPGADAAGRPRQARTHRAPAPARARARGPTIRVRSTGGRLSRRAPSAGGWRR